MSVEKEYHDTILVDYVISTDPPAGTVLESTPDTVVTIHEKLNEILEEQKDLPDPVALTKPEVKRLLEESGVEESHLEDFDQQYEMAAGSQPALMAANLTNTRKMEIKTPDIVIAVDPAKTQLIETQVIDGRKFLVIPMDGDIEINGIHVK